MRPSSLETRGAALRRQRHAAAGRDADNAPVEDAPAAVEDPAPAIVGGALAPVGDPAPHEDPGGRPPPGTDHPGNCSIFSGGSRVFLVDRRGAEPPVDRGGAHLCWCCNNCYVEGVP